MGLAWLVRGVAALSLARRGKAARGEVGGRRTRDGSKQPGRLPVLLHCASGADLPCSAVDATCVYPHGLDPCQVERQDGRSFVRHRHGSRRLDRVRCVLVQVKPWRPGGRGRLDGQDADNTIRKNAKTNMREVRGTAAPAEAPQAREAARSMRIIRDKNRISFLMSCN